MLYHQVRQTREEYYVCIDVALHNITVIISSPIDANVSLGSTVTFSCAVERADFIVWFVNGTLNAEHNPFDGTVTLVRQQGIELVKELQLEASLLLNNSEISCTAGNVQAELVSSSRARVLIQGTYITL